MLFLFVLSSHYRPKLAPERCPVGRAVHQYAARIAVLADLAGDRLLLLRSW